MRYMIFLLAFVAFSAMSQGADPSCQCSCGCFVTGKCVCNTAKVPNAPAPIALVPAAPVAQQAPFAYQQSMQSFSQSSCAGGSCAAPTTGRRFHILPRNR